MRKVLLVITAAVIGLGMSSARADVFVFASIAKFKTIIINETLDVDKDVFLDVLVTSAPDKFAESIALINQRNFNSEGCGNCAEKSDSIRNSANGNAGILSINEASGNMMNQANAVSASVDVRTVGNGPNGEQNGFEGGVGFAESQAAVSQDNRDSRITTVDLIFRDAEIVDSFNNNSGVIHANQGTGNMGNQANALSLAVSFADEGVALSEADLGQFNVMNVVSESDSLGGNLVDGCPGANCGFGISKTASVRGSINGNQGIVGVNTTSGNFANQANVVSFSAVQI